MIETIKAAFSSKKFLATVIGAVLVAVGSALGISEDQSMKIAGIICAYILGQGLADHSKEAAQVEADLHREINDADPAARAAALEAEID